MQEIVILTGAGISAESGISTFRDHNGLWENHPIEDVATPEGFSRNPQLVYQFYNQRRNQLNNGTVQPNEAHKALAMLEKHLGDNLTLITQNVDDLHERAGNSNIYHMHGELNKVRCMKCGAIHSWYDDCDVTSICPDCAQAHSLRPHIVWFGEMPFYMDFIEEKLLSCDIFVSIGTSGQVYPAAGFVQTVRNMNPSAHTLEINLEPSNHNSVFHEHRHGKAGTFVPIWVKEILKSN